MAALPLHLYPYSSPDISVNWIIPQKDIVKGKKLGEGAFGTVYKGYWKGQIDVAIKTMNSDYMVDDFIKEANVMKELLHPNVVLFYGVVLSRTFKAIIMEYMEGGSLRDVLKTRTSITYAELLKFCSEICSGMDYLHKNNNIHRDLAARNCLVDADSTIKVADFGLSRYVPDDLYYQSTYGVFALRWAPPEVYKRRYTKKADVWSYGVVMWEIFSAGKTPYANLSNSQVENYVKAGGILGQPDGCPDDVYKVMTHCWKYDMEERPSFPELSRLMDSCKDNESYSSCILL